MPRLNGGRNDDSGSQGHDGCGHGCGGSSDGDNLYTSDSGQGKGNPS
jgi:hypothetical protein